MTQSPKAASNAASSTSTTTTVTAANVTTDTAASSRPLKHGGFDRTGDWTTRTKMTQELAKVINDGLYYYEQDLWEDSEWVSGDNSHCGQS